MGLEDLRKNRPQPPMDWFTALGYQDKGILNVSANKNFTGLADGQVKRHYDVWCNYISNPVTTDDPPERVERARKDIADAEAFIIQTTGFSPREVSDMAHRLCNQYRGKKASPLKTELF